MLALAGPHVNVFFTKTPRWVLIEISKGKPFVQIFVDQAKEIAEEKTELGLILKEYFNLVAKFL